MENPEVIKVMHRICISYFTLYSLFYSAICTTCRKKQSERVTSEAKWLWPEKETQSESALASEQETESERSTITNQYFEFYKEEQFEALSRSTLLKILEVREAS